jgi:hypothetical protein
MFPLLLSVMSFAACSSESVTVDLQFQTLDYALISDQAEILAFKHSDGTRCPELSMRARTRTLSEAPKASSGSYPLCEFRDGGAGLELPPGEYDLLGVAKNRVGFVMVVGCTHAHISESANDVTIPMGILSAEARAALQEGEFTCPSLAARCSGKCD